MTALLPWGFFTIVESALLLPAPAAASCVESKIAIAASTVSMDGKVTAAWQLSPPCNIIESGLLIGFDQETFVPVGTPFYTLQETYRQDLLALDPGNYWLVAYARDEDGTVIQSFPWPVYVIDVAVSDPSQAARTLSFEAGPSVAAATPSYSGTDDDFLKPEGDTHLSMLKTWSREHKSQLKFGTTIEVDDGFRQLGDTSRDAALSRQLEPFQGVLNNHDS